MKLTDTFSFLMSAGFDIMSSAIATTGAIVVQIGDAVNAVVDSDKAEWYQHTGFRSVAAKPTSGSPSCQGLAIRRGDHDMVFATKDERASSMWADLNPDEAEIYSLAGKCRVVVRANGNVEIDVSGGNVNVNAGSGTVNLTTTGTVNVGGSGAKVNLSGSGHPVPFADIIDGFINVFLTTWTPTPMDGGAALKLALTTWATTSVPPYTTTGSQNVKTG